MFYSQFILAKKGPLGTIWIAAHLERKLRKNQVADTDIGVSVDSILFPDVPIALRLSSHLLLGVVRIYSRKVNYLFDDCSEALLKIKQAFRSTAVDLPPEESTAPYHSITLPETFDLDDFELPDSDIFQGNYVDHHVSSREQITLQDTMEGVVYSTSQFGPDERFGDGDASGLDLDEELLLDKIAAVGEAGPILSSDTGLRVKQAENHVAMTENLGTVVASGDAHQIEGGDEDADFAEYAQAPCTPGLMEEPNLSNVQEISACDDHMETDNQNTAEFSVKGNLENACSKSELQQEKQNLMDWSLVNEHNNPDSVPPVAAEKNGYHSDDLESCQIKQPLNDNTPARDNDDLESSHLMLPQLGKSPLTMDHQISLENNPYSLSSSSADQIRRRASPAPELSSDDGPDRVEVLVNGTSERSVGGQINEDFVEFTLGESTTPGTFTTTGTCHPPVSEVSLLENNQEKVSNDGEIAGSLAEKQSDESNHESGDRLGGGKMESQACQQSKGSEIEMKCSGPHLWPCTTTCLNQPSPLTLGGGDDLDLPFEEVFGLRSKDSSARDEAVHVPGGDVVATDISKQVLEENHKSGPLDSCEGIQERSSNRSMDQFLGDDLQLGNINSSICSDFPAPEKLLSVPEGHTDVENNFLVEEATPDKEAVMGFDRAGAVSESVSGKKRSFTESSLTVQSLYSAESLGLQHTKGTVESVPDDNDLLSSILVGRKSSVLKVKATPTVTTSMKRSRSATRTSSSKRKVLMDDSMVLHGDTIRQQLTNTQDIRRVRKKAPCTRPEISMIQKQFWEDEIFNEPILTGESTELASLHNQTYDLSEIRVSQCDVNDGSLEVAADPKLLSEGIAVEAVNCKDMSSRLDVTKESGIDGSSEPMMVRDEASHVQFADTLILRENEQYEDQTLSSDIYSTQVPMNICTSDIPEAKRSSPHESYLGSEIYSTQELINPDSAFAVESSSHRNGEADAALHIEFEAFSTLEGLDSNEAAGKNDNDDNIAAVGKIGDNEAAGENDDGIAGADKIDANKETLGKNGDEIAAVVEIESRAKDELEGTEGGSSVEFRPDIQPVSNPSATYSPEMVTPNKAVMEEEQIRKNDQEQTVNEEDTILDAQVNEYDAKGSVSNGICGEQDSSNPAEMDLRNTFSGYDGENTGGPEAYPQFVTEAEVSATDMPHLHDDFDYSTAGHDTEFLNFDDDEEAEVDGDDIMPSAEETRFLENSGWSSRTRAVASYLQTLFEKEAERGRKVIPIDNLLAGKTRKEASRMFFEALVLKTKDYVHVEQKTPFDNINIFPCLKLLKSDF